MSTKLPSSMPPLPKSMPPIPRSVAGLTKGEPQMC